MNPDFVEIGTVIDTATESRIGNGARIRIKSEIGTIRAGCTFARHVPLNVVSGGQNPTVALHISGSASALYDMSKDCVVSPISPVPAICNVILQKDEESSSSFDGSSTLVLVEEVYIQAVYRNKLYKLYKLYKRKCISVTPPTSWAMMKNS
ncbi:hypothetical protein EVAR_376_1 [Eumeta japonica]|uniref:Uncharacterized protein n=1 Tax=Eumeta variegata TaxID=151549 RepID=A0A4C1SA35_EUMVA|nr:hypothetical protein EVAR_376_1 [Eumeta japonica]